MQTSDPQCMFCQTLQSEQLRGAHQKWSAEWCAKPGGKALVDKLSRLGDIVGVVYQHKCETQGLFCCRTCKDRVSTDDKAISKHDEIKRDIKERWKRYLEQLFPSVSPSVLTELEKIYQKYY